MYKFSEVPELLEKSYSFTPMKIHRGENDTPHALFYFQVSKYFIFPMGDQCIFQLSMGGEKYSIDLVLLTVTFNLNHSGYGNLL